MVTCPKCGLIHERCTGHRRSIQPPTPCMRYPVRGHTVCPMHGGGAPQVKAAAGRNLALAAAVTELQSLGVPVDVEPSEAMLAMVAEAAGNVTFLRAKVQELAQHVDAGPDDPDDETALGAGIAGRVDPENWKGAPHVLVVMYDAERERLVRWAKMCRDAGVDERRVKLAEEQGRQIAEVLRAAMSLVFTAARRAVTAGTLTDVQLGEVDRALRTVEELEAPRLVRQAIETSLVGL